MMLRSRLIGSTLVGRVVSGCCGGRGRSLRCSTAGPITTISSRPATEADALNSASNLGLAGLIRLNNPDQLRLIRPAPQRPEPEPIDTLEAVGAIRLMALPAAR